MWKHYIFYSKVRQDGGGGGVAKLFGEGQLYKKACLINLQSNSNWVGGEEGRTGQKGGDRDLYLQVDANMPKYGPHARLVRG